MLHRLIAPQIKQLVPVDIHVLAGSTVTVQRLLEPGLGKLGDALQVLEGFGQFNIGQTAAGLTDHQRLAQPGRRIGEPLRWLGNRHLALPQTRRKAFEIGHMAVFDPARQLAFDKCRVRPQSIA